MLATLNLLAWRIGYALGILGAVAYFGFLLFVLIFAGELAAIENMRLK